MMAKFAETCRKVRQIPDNNNNNNNKKKLCFDSRITSIHFTLKMQ